MSAPLPNPGIAPVNEGFITPDALSARSIGQKLYRNWALVAVGFVVPCVIALVMALLKNPVYASSLAIRIDDTKPGIAGIEILQSVAGRQGSELSTEMQMLRSRSLAEATVDSLGLQARTSVSQRFAGFDIRVRPVSRAEVMTLTAMRRGIGPANYRLQRTADSAYKVVDRGSGRTLALVRPGALVDLGDLRFILSPGARQYETINLDVLPFSQAVRGVQAGLTVNRPQRDANFVTVSFESEDQSMASAVPNALVSKFLGLRDLIQKTEARSTARFLRQQIDTLSRQLAMTEDALQAFREGNRVVSLSAEASMRVSELAKLQGERNAKEAERSALSAAISAARAAASRAGPDTSSPYRTLIAFPTLISTNVSQYLQALNEAENQRALLLQRRTREDRDVQALTARVRELEQQLSGAAQAYLDGLTSQVRSMDATLSSLGQQMERIPSKEIQFARLDRQNKVLVEIFTLLQTRLQEAQIAQAVEDSRVQVVDPAAPALVPVRPNKRRYLLMGVLAGLLVGAAAAFAREALDYTVHTREDLTDATGVTCLAIIPHLSRDLADKGHGSQRILHGSNRRLMGRAAMSNPRNPVTEAYRGLRTNLAFALPKREDGNVIVFASPTPGDGKTTTVANLASILAQQGQRVMAVDADMRRGSLNDVFGIPRNNGLADLLAGRTTLESARHVVDLADMGVVHLIPSGAFPANPSELLASERLTALLRELRASYDYILFDSSPVNLVTDAAIVGSRADGVVLVGRAGKTERGAMSYAAELLRKVRAPLMGTVLNDFSVFRDSRYAGDSGYGYYYSGDYAYYADNGDSPAEHRRRSKAERN